MNKRIGTIILLALVVTSSILALSPISDTTENNYMVQKIDNGFALAESSMNISIPYVDNHYGSADGLIDPTEYAYHFTDPVTGVKSYFEHNGTMLFVGLEALTHGWIGFAWQNYTSNFTTAGLNNSDVIVGYAPGTTTTNVWRVIGTDAVTVHYVLSLRNGTTIQDGFVPDETSVDPIEEAGVLQAYKDAIIGMRIGEVRHFVIPAADAYDTSGHELYGQDLIYDITLTRIYRSGITRTLDPTDQSLIIYSDEHGTNTFQHLPDADQSQIIQADGSDNGTITQLEYIIKLNSTDPYDIPLFNNTDLTYPFIFMYGLTEELNGLPVQHTYWTNPAKVQIVPNTPPTMVVISPEADSTIQWVSTLKLNATNDYVRRAFYQVDNETWETLTYNFLTDLWEKSVDFSLYDEGLHVLSFNASDTSNATGLVSFNFTIDRPYTPLLGMKLRVTRNLITMPNFGSRAEDSYVVTNNGSAPINSIDIYLPDEYESNILDFVVTDSSGGTEFPAIRLSNANGLVRWRVHFPDPVGFQESLSFKTITYLHSLFYLTDEDTFEYRISFIRYPILPYVLTSAEFTLSFESGGSLVPNEPSPNLKETNVAPYTTSPFSVLLRLFTENIIARRTTTIVVDAWGWLSYEEVISLENTGGGEVVTLPMTLPAYSASIRIYDEVGDLASSQTQPGVTTADYNETRQLEIKLATDRFGPNGFQPSFKYTFKISYVVQASAYQSAATGGSLLEFPMALLGDVLILVHDIKIVMTTSVQAFDIAEGHHIMYGVFDTSYLYEYTNETQRNPAELYVVYQTTLGAAARPALFSLIIGIIAALYVSYRKVELPEEVVGPHIDDTDIYQKPKQVGAPADLLSEFANLYSRKTTLNIDLEKLDASRRRGKIKKREYMMRESDLKAQIEEIDKKLPSVKEELTRYGARYRDLIAQLELQDERIEGAKAGLRQLLMRKKKQRISRVAFEKSRQDYLKTIQKATSATDRILLSIQEEAGEA